MKQAPPSHTPPEPLGAYWLEHTPPGSPATCLCGQRPLPPRTPEPGPPCAAALWAATALLTAGAVLIAAALVHWGR
ncbi:hypothetical protein [Streptomyces sp. NPDC054863]